ncbi:hypothetical protein SYNPS1DRAFT_27147 [Syncephalis pseudoplumigaleata]|uniref:Uncharacterized protein n=1 Tax=Syncephalis pseudoplumigaleata TaxID=1712513 RepID=A0A4V1J236_9FUNG|nr:hypothetical protein SYNPS1DRAFT_27147 [Syncephalis pseudoplumigaleata]|eukprot:RKP27189.1 hypothetical protein SYNPS1DRAFT_27147 [Syncephalis pseudoplumigaleata]
MLTSDDAVDVSVGNKKESNAKIAEIVSKRRQAERMASTKPATAATVYFNMAKALWQVHAGRETARTLDMLCALLRRDDAVGQAASSDDDALSAGQARKLLGLATVGLMRICALVGQHDMAVEHGMRAFTDYTDLDGNVIQQLAFDINEMPVADAQAMCRALAKQATLRRSTDGCLVGSHLLSEIAGYAMAEASRQMSKGQPADTMLELCLALYMLAYELGRREKRADVLIMAGELVAAVEHSAQFISEHAQLWHAIVSDLLLLFMESIEHADNVRCEAFEQLFASPTMLCTHVDGQSVKWTDIDVGSQYAGVLAVH